VNVHRHLLNASALAVAALVIAGCDKPSTESTAAPTATVTSGTTAPAASAAPAAAPQTQRDAYEAASKGTGFTTGPVMAANTVYVFFDPTCPHCAALWNNARELQTKLKIVWMPIGLLRSSSGPQGAAILSSKDPVAAMTENETSVLAHGGGITVPQNLSDDVLNKVKANTDIFKSLNAESVPLIVYRNSKNGQFGKHDGAVSAADLSDMVGL
jgi:thiol:disulfide interchange protein DsbG